MLGIVTYTESYLAILGMQVSKLRELPEALRDGIPTPDGEDVFSPWVPGEGEDVHPWKAVSKIYSFPLGETPPEQFHLRNGFLWEWYGNSMGKGSHHWGVPENPSSWTHKTV